MKQTLKKIFTEVTGLTLYKKLPHGQNSFEDIKFKFKNYSFDHFFDVGANVGQSIADIRKYFPNSDIWSFEPVKSTYDKLIQNKPDKKVKCFQIGFGTQKEDLDIYINKDTTTSDMVSFNATSDDSSSFEKETVKIDTLDSFCSSEKVNKVDYLKIDTEGFDLNVLKGATTLLRNNQIKFIETEVSMNPENTFHVKFEDVKEYLEQFNYRLYGIYEQTPEWMSKKPILRRVNAVFISPTVYE